MHEVNSPRTDDESIEQEIVRKGLIAPRITPAHIEGVIVKADYRVFPGTMLTVCCLTLKNGYPVTGESACASPENFDPEIGRKVARENAKQKIWALEGYLLKHNLGLNPIPLSVPDELLPYRKVELSGTPERAAQNARITGVATDESNW